MSMNKTKGGRYRIDFRDESGRRYRKSFDRQRDAEKALTKSKTAIWQGEFLAPRESRIFRSAGDAWLRSKQSHRPNTVAEWSRHLKRLNDRLGDYPIEAIGVDVIEEVRDELRAGDNENRALAPGTVNAILTTASAVFKFAIRKGWARRNPAAEAERLRADSSEILDLDGERTRDGKASPDEVLTPEEIRRLVDAAKEGLYQTLLTTVALTGLRSGEALGLRWTDIDLKEQKLTVRRTLTWVKTRTKTKEGQEVEEYEPKFFGPKTNAGRRTIPLPDELVSALKPWKLKCPPSGKLDLVFPTPTGRPAHRKNVLQKGLWPALTHAKLRRVTMHSLRHSFASALIEGNAPVTEVQYYLGHSTPTVTLNTYSHWFKQRETGAIDRLARTMFGKAGGVQSVQDEPTSQQVR